MPTQVFNQLQISTAAAVPPLTVNQTALVTNFNADLLDGQHGAYYATAASLSGYLPLTGGTLTGTLTGTVGIFTTLRATELTSPLATNGPITITPDGTGHVHINSTDIRLGKNNTNATLATRGTGDLILRTHEGSAVEGFIRIHDGANGNIEITPNGTGTVVVGKLSGSTASFSGQITSTLASGTAPLVVTSNTVVDNLNSDFLDGQHGSFYQNAGNLNVGTLQAARLPAFSGGDVTSTVGTVGLNLTAVGTAGTYRSVTTDSKGRVTGGTNPTTLAGYGITDALPLAGGTLSGLLTASAGITMTGGRIYVSSPASGQTYGGTIHIRDDQATGANNSFAGIAFSSAPGADFVIGKYSNAGVGRLQIRNHQDTVLATIEADGSASFAGGLTATNFTGPGTGLTGTAAGLSIGGSAAQLNGQAASFYQNAGNLNVGTLLAARMPAFTGGDVTSTAGTVALTLANSGVTAGTYRSVTTDAKGRVTAGTNPTTLAGYGITDALPLTGGTLSGTLSITNTGPVIILRDSDSVAGASQIGYISLQDSAGTERGWIGFGSTVNTDLTMYNGRGDVVLSSSTGIARVGSNAIIHAATTSAPNLSVGGSAGSVAWTGVTGKPTTLAGYGITDALPLSGGTLTGGLTGTSANFNGTFIQTGEAHAVDACAIVHNGNVESYYQLSRRLQAFSHLGSTTTLEIEAVTLGNGGYSGEAQRTTWRISSRGALYVTRHDEHGGAGKVFLKILNDTAVPDANGQDAKYVVGLVCGNTTDYVMVWMRARFLQESGTSRWVTIARLATAVPSTVSGSAMTYSSGWIANTGFTNTSFTEVVPAGKFSALALTGVLTSTVATGTAPLSITSTTLVNNLNSDLLDGQHGSYFEGRDTTAVGFSGGTLTLTRAAGNLTANLDGRYLPLAGGTMSGDLTATRIRGVNSLVLNTFTTVNPASNVFLYSQPNDRDAWLFLDSADTGSNWGIYHRQIDSAVSGLPANSIGFIGGGSSALQAWISLANGSANFQGALTQAGNQVLHAGNYTSYALPIGGGTLTGGLSGTTGSFSGQITSTVAIGTAPFVVTSTTRVNNLNVQYLDGQIGAYYAAASSLASYLPKSGGAMTGALTLHSTGTNGFYNGTGDAATYALYNFKLGGWNGMAFENLSTGGTYPSQVVGVINFREGTIDMKGGFKVNGASVITENQSITISGDASGTGKTAINLTLASVGTAGTYRSVTVNAKGLVTAGTNPTTLAGYGITDALPLTGGTLTGALNGTTASFSGNVKGGRITLRDDCLEQHVDDSDSVGVFVNYFGFASGTTRFRNFGVFNGKNQQLFYITGSTGAAQLNGQLSVNGTTASDILRLYTTGSTIWKLGVTDASGSLFNITADFGNFTINKTNGNVTTPGAFVGANFSGPGTGLTGTAASLTAGAVPWSGVTGKPTTLAGYGITDAISSGIDQQGGRPYTVHDFNTYPTLYSTIFVNPTGSTNLPTGMSAAMSYRFIMGAGDTATRGFDLVGAAEGSGNLYIRERSLGTWSRVLHSNNFPASAPNSGATAGTYNNVTVTAKGLVTGGSNVSYLTGNQTITLGGDLSGSGTTSITATIANSAVTNAKLNTMGAATIKGNNGGVANSPSDLSVAQVATMLSGQTMNINGSATSVPWTGVTGKPTTLSGYGITDALPLTGGTLTGGLQVAAGHGTTRFQLYENYNGDPNHAQAAFLTLWASEPGLSWEHSGIGGNINNSGQYYGRAGSGNPYGVYLRFDVDAGESQFWNTTGTPGSINGQGTLRAKIAVDGEIYATSTQHKVIHAGNYTSYPPARWATGRTISLTGDVTGTSGTFDGTADLSFGVTIANDTVTNAKLKTMGATTIKGNNGGVANSPSDLTPAQVATMLSGQTMNIAGSATSVPWSGITSKPTTISGFGITDIVSSNAGSPVAADTTTKNGFYYVNSNISLFGQTDGALFVQAYDNTWASQIYQDYRTGQLAIRGRNSGTWQAWRTVLDSTNFLTAAPNSGVTAGTYNNVTVNAKGIVTGGSNVSYLTGNQTISLTGDLTGSGTTSITATIAGDSITNAKLKTMAATTIKGNNTAVANAPADLTPAQVATMLSNQTMNINGSSASCTGNAATATNGFTVKPGWAGNQNLILEISNFNNSLPSGFYQGYQATNSPSATWYNLINIRHSNTANDHGFQLAMSYYDETLWSRSYQGGTGANNGTFTAWRAHLHSGNFSSYALPLTGGTLTGTLTAPTLQLANGFQIQQGASSYGQFSNWVHLNGSYGFYSGVNNAHIYPNNATYGAWRIQGTRGGWGGIEFENNNVSLMMGSDTVGFHQNGNGWLFRVHQGVGYIYKGSWGGGTAATILDSSNYNSYAFGLSTNNAVSGSNTYTNTNLFKSAVGSTVYLGSANTPPLQAYSSDGGPAFMSFHRGGSYAVNMGLDPDNVLRIGGWSAAANRWQLDMSGNNTIPGTMTAASFSGAGTGLTGTASSLTAGSSTSCSGSAAQLNGQAASYYENRDTTAVGISAGTLTLTRAAGNLTTTIGGRIVAWCEFNGNFASTQSPNAGFNVSSITKNASGDYTVNFTSALANTNYVVSGYAQLDTTNNTSNYNLYIGVPRRSGAKATGSCRIACEYPGNSTLYDSVSVGVAFIAA